MKRFIGSGSKVAIGALALSVFMVSVVTPAARADWKMWVTPQSWFAHGAENVDQQALNEAKAQAEEAQAQADLALKSAQEALRKVQEAQKRAEALQTHTKFEKPVVKMPSRAFNTQQTALTDQAQDTTGEETEAYSEKSLWHLGVKTPEKATANQKSQPEASASPVSKPAAYQANALKEKINQDEQTSANKQAAQESTEQSHASCAGLSNPWNPITWFAKPASYQSGTQAATAQEHKTVPDQSKPFGFSSVASEDTPQSAEVDIKTKAALIETEKGNIAFELYPDQAPLTVANFVKLVNDGFYNRFNMKFHRVVPGFVVQTGDPTGTGAGGSKERVPLETKNKLSHNAKGVVAMARGADPNSATSQFYITLAPQVTLDGKYAIFGRVISGLDVLDKIEKDDMLYGIRLVDLNTLVRDAQPEKKKFFSSLF